MKVERIMQKVSEVPDKDIVIASPFYEVSFEDENAGLDLRCWPHGEDCIYAPVGGVVLVPTGIKIRIPVGIVGMVSRRSGIDGFVIDNAPAIIDPGYRGELKVKVRVYDRYLFSCSLDTDLEGFSLYVKFPKGLRFSQLCLLHTFLDNNIKRDIWITNDLEVYDEFDTLFPSKRGINGFGSTGFF